MFSIITFPSYLGQRLKSSQNTPINFLKYIKYNKKGVYHIQTQNKKLIQNLYQLYHLNQKIIVPKINIGGDHSMAISTIASNLQKFPNLKVVWIDAHPDINTFKSSSTKNIHGMPLAYLTGLDDFLNIDFIRNKLNFENLLYIGIRDIDPFEKEIIQKYNINYIKVHDVNNELNYTLHKIKNFIKDDYYHVSFDVDSLDPNVLDSTGTPVENGLGLYQTKHILDLLYQKNLVGLDIVELNLELGNKNKSLSNLSYLFQNYFANKNKL